MQRACQGASLLFSLCSWQGTGRHRLVLNLFASVEDDFMKKLKLRKNSIYYTLALALMVAAIFLVSGTPSVVRASKATRELPIYCVQRDDNCVSLTFDAAWGDVRVRQSRKPMYSKGFTCFSYTVKQQNQTKDV